MSGTALCRAASTLSQNLVRVVDGHLSRHHKVKLREGGAAGVPGPKVVRFDGTRSLDRDDLADSRQRLVRHRLVHQSAQRLLHHPPARPEDVDRNQRRHQRVENPPSRGECQKDSDRDPRRRHHVGPQMPPVGDQSGRPQPATTPDQDRGPNAVQNRRADVDEQTLDRRVQNAGSHEPMVRLAEDEKRRDDDHHAFQNCAEELCLMVPERVVRVGRSGGDPDCDEGGEGRREVDDALQRIGQQRHGSRDPPRKGLESKDEASDQDTSNGEFQCEVHEIPGPCPDPSGAERRGEGRSPQLRLSSRSMPFSNPSRTAPSLSSISSWYA